MNVNLHNLGRFLVILFVFGSLGSLASLDVSNEPLQNGPDTVNCVVKDMITNGEFLVTRIDTKELNEKLIGDYFYEPKVEEPVVVVPEVKEPVVVPPVVVVPVIPQKPMSVSKLNELPEDASLITVTAYNMGSKTSTGKHVKEGIIAATKELITRWGYGSKLGLYRKTDNGFVLYGTYILEDRMHESLKNTVDIYIPTRSAALKFGRQKMWIVKLN